jgi:hypothetical protein
MDKTSESRRAATVHEWLEPGRRKRGTRYFGPPSVHMPMPSLKTIFGPYWSDIFARQAIDDFPGQIRICKTRRALAGQPLFPWMQA